MILFSRTDFPAKLLVAPKALNSKNHPPRSAIGFKRGIQTTWILFLVDWLDYRWIYANIGIWPMRTGLRISRSTG